MEVEVGRIVYTGMLNDKGGMESDCTVTKITPSEYLLVTSTAQGTKDMDWLKRNIPDDAFVTFTDVTSA